jgi:hypothetical protein
VADVADVADVIKLWKQHNHNLKIKPQQNEPLFNFLKRYIF